MPSFSSRTSLLTLLVLSAAAIVAAPGCNSNSGKGTDLTLSLSTDNVKMAPGQTLDVMVTIKSNVNLDSQVVLSLRSPGDEALPTGLNAAFDPPLVQPSPGNDTTAKLHLLAMPTLSGESFPLVVYARNKAQEATAVLNLTLLGGSGNWRRPIASAGTDQIAAMSGDHGDGVYVAVNTTGGFADGKNMGDFDAYLMHYRGNGAVSFVTPLRTGSSDIINAIAVDSDDNVYLAGYTYGIFPGQSGIGKADAFLAKVSSAGTLAWLQQLGTSEIDQLTGVAVAPDGSVYVTGHTEGDFPGYTNAGAIDVFVGHYGADGKRDWVMQFGSDADEKSNNVIGPGLAITVDAQGNVFVAGSTQGVLPGGTSLGLGDAFITRLNPQNGTIVWLKQVGSYADDAILSLAAHPNGTIYAAGWAKGPFPGQIQMGGQDGLVLGYKADGTQTVARQFGTSYADSLNGINVVGDRLYVAGTTRGAFAGQMQYGQQDVFFVRLTPEGSTLWLRQIGTTQSDTGQAFTGSLGQGMNLYLGGVTFGDWDKDVTLAESDGFLNQYQLD